MCGKVQDEGPVKDGEGTVRQDEGSLKLAAGTKDRHSGGFGFRLSADKKRGNVERGRRNYTFIRRLN